MPRTIRIELSDLSDGQYKVIANAICGKLNDLDDFAALGGGSPLRYWVRHDGGPELSRELNEMWDRYGRDSRWS